jgi:hypothetical protein
MHASRHARSVASRGIGQERIGLSRYSFVRNRINEMTEPPEVVS